MHLVSLLCLTAAVFVLVAPFEETYVNLAAGIGAYLVYSTAVRNLVPWHHRRGVARLRAGRWTQAIDAFEKSMLFFRRLAWLDRWRGLLLCTPSLYGFREMALLNIAYCHQQLGQAEQARHWCRQCLQLNPANELARRGLADPSH